MNAELFHIKKLKFKSFQKSKRDYLILKLLLFEEWKAILLKKPKYEIQNKAWSFPHSPHSAQKNNNWHISKSDIDGQTWSFSMHGQFPYGKEVDCNDVAHFIGIWWCFHLLQIKTHTCRRDKVCEIIRAVHIYKDCYYCNK